DTSGITPEFGLMRNLIPAAGGRFVDPMDMEKQRRVAFLGNKLAADIFGSVPAVGKTLLVNQSPFLVIGVLKEKDQDSSYSGRDADKMFIPSTTFRALTGSKYVNNFVFQAASAADTKELIKRLSAAMGKRLRFDA